MNFKSEFQTFGASFTNVNDSGKPAVAGAAIAK